jgi:hypothetical protein
MARHIIKSVLIILLILSYLFLSNFVYRYGPFFELDASIQLKTNYIL